MTKLGFNYITIKQFRVEQMKIAEEIKVPINYEAAGLSEEIKVLRPVVFRHGDSYCCLLGPDPQTGIFGAGTTPGKAMSDWTYNLIKRMHLPNENDKVLQYVQGIFNASNNSWED